MAAGGRDFERALGAFLALDVGEVESDASCLEDFRLRPREHLRALENPKTFSLQTLRFVAELDEEMAATFEKYVPSVVNEDFMPFPFSLAPHPQSIELFRLEEFGLILGAQGTLSKSVTREKGAHGFHYKSHTLVLVLGAKQEILIPAILLTRVGKEIYSITHADDDVEQARRFANEIPKPNVESIHYVSRSAAEAPIELWSKPLGPALD
jgi:hypothetical protein